MGKIKGAVIVAGAGGPLEIMHARSKMKHGCETWARCMRWDLISGKKFNGFDMNQYDVVLVNGNLEALDLIVQIKAGFGGKIIFLIEGSLLALSYYRTSEKIRYIQILRLVDAIGTLNTFFEWYRLFTAKPIFWLGIPFPVSAVKKYSLPIDQREHKWALGSNLNTHNTIGSLFVAGKARVKRCLLQEFKGDNLDDFCSQLGVDIIEKHRPFPWMTFLKRYASCWGGINMSNEYTWGRYALDFAALGMPVVGSTRQFTQNILFPTISFEPYAEVDKAVATVKRLETDLEYYKSIMRYAERQLVLFTEKAAKERMESLLEEIL